MSFFNEATDTIDVEALEALLKTDLIAVANELIEMFSVYEFAEADGVELDDVPDFELLQVERDNDGDGNYMYSVLEFRLNGVSYGFVRIGGTYSSWDGSEYDSDDLTVVTPKRVVTTEYIAVDGSEDDRYEEIL